MGDAENGPSSPQNGSGDGIIEQQVQNLTQKNADLQNLLNEANAAKEQAEREIDAANTENDRVKTENTNLRNQLDAADAEKERVERERDGFQRQLEEVEKELEQAKKELDDPGQSSMSFTDKKGESSAQRDVDILEAIHRVDDLVTEVRNQLQVYRKEKPEDPRTIIGLIRDLHAAKKELTNELISVTSTTEGLGMTLDKYNRVINDAQNIATVRQALQYLEETGGEGSQKSKSLDKFAGSDADQPEINEIMASYPAIKLTAEEQRKLEDHLAKFEENAEELENFISKIIFDLNGKIDKIIDAKANDAAEKAKNKYEEDQKTEYNKRVARMLGMLPEEILPTTIESELKRIHLDQRKKILPSGHDEIEVVEEAARVQAHDQATIQYMYKAREEQPEMLRRDLKTLFLKKPWLVLKKKKQGSLVLYTLCEPENEQPESRWLFSGPIGSPIVIRVETEQMYLCDRAQEYDPTVGSWFHEFMDAFSKPGAPRNEWVSSYLRVLKTDNVNVRSAGDNVFEIGPARVRVEKQATQLTFELGGVEEPKGAGIARGSYAQRKLVELLSEWGIVEYEKFLPKEDEGESSTQVQDEEKKIVEDIDSYDGRSLLNATTLRKLYEIFLEEGWTFDPEYIKSGQIAVKRGEHVYKLIDNQKEETVEVTHVNRNKSKPFKWKPADHLEAQLRFMASNFENQVEIITNVLIDFHKNIGKKNLMEVKTFYQILKEYVPEELFDELHNRIDNREEYKVDEYGNNSDEDSDM